MLSVVCGNGGGWGRGGGGINIIAILLHQISERIFKLSK